MSHYHHRTIPVDKRGREGEGGGGRGVKRGETRRGGGESEGDRECIERGDKYPTCMYPCSG